MSTCALPITVLLIFTCGTTALSAETLDDVLRASKVPVQQFSTSDLTGKITSYAVSKDGPFLLAYFVDNGSGVLQPPLRIIRYDRATDSLRRTDLRNISALFQSELLMNCLESVVDIREYRDTIYIGTHSNPSAGCVIVLSLGLEFKAALSGRLVGFIGADYAILRRSEIHFMSVHPLHLAVFDVRQNQATEIYPYTGDLQRRQFSRLIEPLISKKWCLEIAAQCDSGNFDTDLLGKVTVNETAYLFAFQAQFNVSGFGPAVEKQIPTRTVTYIFRERNGRWEHRQFDAQQLQRLIGKTSLEELVTKSPGLAFPRENATRKP
ncbi:MAG: hypothetical protein ABI693_21325 [Bryobacteraceae bacterium]